MGFKDVLKKLRKPDRPKKTDGSENRISFLEDLRSKERVKICENAVSLVLGIDFGTSCCKVVVGDNRLPRTYAIGLHSNGSGVENFLHATCLFESPGEVYSLDVTGNCLIRDNLKLRFLEAQRSSDQKLPVEADIYAVAYLALLIQRSLGYFKERYFEQYPETTIRWFLNVGMPSRDVADKCLIPLYKRAAIAACLASDARLITRKICLEAWQAARPGQNRFFEFLDARINVYPEIAAEMVSFIRSPFSRDGLFALADVGAGTLDVSTFQLNSHTAQDRIHFRAMELGSLGAQRLHQERTAYLEKQQIQAEKISSSGSIFIVPESHNDYVVAQRDRENAAFHLKNHDEQFSNACRELVVKTIMATHVHHARQGWNSSFFRNGVELFLCGGGSRLNFYQSMIRKAGRSLGRYLDIKGSPPIRLRKLTKPRDLSIDGVANEHFDRFAVAYGLSVDRRNLPGVTVGELQFELREAKRSKKWNDVLSAEELYQVLQSLLYPEIPHHQLPVVSVMRPVTLRSLLQISVFEGQSLYRLSKAASNLAKRELGIPVRFEEYDELPDEVLIAFLRANQRRVEFKASN